MIFHLILTESRTVLVINGGHRSPPVNDDGLGTFVRNAYPSHIVGFFLRKLFVAEVDPSEIRLFSRLFTAHQISSAVLQLSLGIPKQRKCFFIFWSIGLHKIIDFFRKRPDLLPGVLQIALCDGKNVSQLFFFFLPA